MAPGGLWDSNRYETKALIKYNGKITDTVPLNFAGPSIFKGEIEVTIAGDYEIIVYSYDPGTGNTGVDKAIVKVF